MWGKDDGITTLVKSISDGSALGSFGQGGGDFLEDRATRNTNIKQCLRKVADGHFTATVKVLSSSGAASYCDDTIKSLKAKHRTLCERDDLRAQHILDALCGEGFTAATDLLNVITSVVNLWLVWRCSPILAEFVAYAPLTPLLKPDSEIQPIAVGTIWRRLVSKVAMKGVGKEMLKYLSDFQFGVGVLGSAESILHSINWVFSEYHNDGSLAMLTVDFSNAFNLMDRSALLHELLLHAWYLEDVTVIRDSEEVAKVLYIIKVSGPCLGLELNIKKTKIFWPSCNGMKLREGLFPVDIWTSSSSVKLLGGAVSRDVYFISGLAIRRAANGANFMGLLPQLHDPQSELLLLRSCMGIAKLFFGLRTCQPVHMEEATLFFDKGLRGSIENIMVCGRPFFGDLQWRVASLPIRFGGLGLYSEKLVSFYAFACLDSFREHAVHCKELPGFKYQHDMVRDVLFDICRHVGISAKKEAPVNFLTDPLDGRSTLSLSDVMVGGKHACMDLTGVSPLIWLSSRGFTTGHATLKATSGKVTKHKKACIENQHVFIPFAFDTFGLLAPEAMELLS
nr:hypothetical protein [Tanacetum cinerariifolium]